MVTPDIGQGVPAAEIGFVRTDSARAEPEICPAERDFPVLAPIPPGLARICLSGGPAPPGGRQTLGTGVITLGGLGSELGFSLATPWTSRFSRLLARSYVLGVFVYRGMW